MENIFPFSQPLFPVPIKPITAAVKAPRHEGAEREEIPHCLHTGVNIFADALSPEPADCQNYQNPS